ncbi:exosortase C-terminal domain/associated protein EpsI [Phenylobacterium sp.]|uniref:exosortase C-terminal domain/associated protein EpsI n=1 Tax=Phenylobacterium sp. TaxID=1871053 RepID=UPI0011FEEF50|nr:exosortase C-terminal domain/associated protein EpsI [Phenylobacterium sp.]THD65112.1 MAG: EpsI family protein [Phenylobacterium sp.]
MTTRRDILMGAACVAGAGATYGLQPHHHVALLGNGKLAEIVPPTFGAWRSEDVGDPLAINGPGTLSAKLYNQLLVRAYTNPTTGQQVLMLLAYGGLQTDDLQLHRPEICYPAFGYALTRNEPETIRISPDVTIPGRRLIGVAQERTESIIYWSRIGESLPSSAAEQRAARLKISMEGIIPDGLLCRFSALPLDLAHPWADIEAFLPTFLAAIAPPWRKVLIGTQRGATLAAEIPKAVV